VTNPAPMPVRAGIGACFSPLFLNLFLWVLSPSVIRAIKNPADHLGRAG